ncbi:flagellar basal body rod protein FlgC [Insolitispirillum peregrinum]|uniref:Flagellar basal-body rod protein FlgC n=1 Tax=Insolitispirillum peregrinum TaxID=80876 RepID=A0A1N7NJP4_9PROT|nr:flagellar basal body rod protein FlgC [Insolitispirillum peregrinum]SIS98532.1 flagellar basal-body rod protein FlgC [Insolitispirillum peregrinum]
MDEITKASRIASAGLKAQAKRLRVVAENMANADSLAKSPGEEPYRRKLITFKSAVDRESGMETVKVDKTLRDTTDFGRKYDPGNPIADATGYVLTPNVNPLVEVMDMREAQRTYEANLNVISMSREMTAKTLDLLK